VNGVNYMIKTDLVIIGAGPAGLSAAIEAAKAGVEVIVLDENLKPGGQLFKQIHKFFGSKDHRAGARGFNIGNQLVEESKKLGVDIKLGVVVYGIFGGKYLDITYDDRVEVLEAAKIIIATGASEKSLSFPGWTLPGVMGAGAAQTMINVNRVLPGKKVLMIGSGNVGLIVSYQLMQAGAEVVGVIEGAPRIGGYGVHASKIRRAGVPIYTSCTIKSASGNNKVEKAEIVQVDENFNHIDGTEVIFDVDVICIAVGLYPLCEIPFMFGCKKTFIPSLGGFVPIHDKNMETTVKGIYVAGDVTGIEEANTAMGEGKLAGMAVANSLGLLSNREYENKKEKIMSQLDSLRTGSFGEKRRIAVEAVEEKFKEVNKLNV